MPPFARLELDLPTDGRAVGLATLGEDHLSLRAVVAVCEHEFVVLFREADRHRLGQRPGAQRIAEGEVVFLDRENVREVGLELELELERLSLHALVLRDDHVLHRLAHEPLSEDRDDVLLEPAGERVPEEERGREILDLAGGKEQRPRPVQLQPQYGEAARVFAVEAVRAAVDVADVVADAEGRALEDRQLRH